MSINIVSLAGRAAIMQREGCRLTAYLDSVGVPTIGVGHTGRMSGNPVKLGMVITKAQADLFLAQDLAPVQSAIGSFVKADITQNQCDALASLIFNIGVTGFQGSTVLRKLNKGDCQGAADAFLMWEKPKVLKSRREAERAQFLSKAANVPQIASAPTTPVLNSIISSVNRAAYEAAPMPQSVAAVTPTSAPPSLWARLRSAFTRKPA